MSSRVGPVAAAAAAASSRKRMMMRRTNISTSLTVPGADWQVIDTLYIKKKTQQKHKITFRAMFKTLSPFYIIKKVTFRAMFKTLSPFYIKKKKM